MSILQRKWYEKLLARLLTLLGFSSTFAFMACYAPPTEEYDYLEVNPFSLSFPAEGGDRSVHIETENKWEVSVSNRFFDITPITGVGSSNIFVRASRNEEEYSREALVQVRELRGGTSQYITVWQEGVYYYLYAGPDSIIFSYEKGQTKHLTVSSNSVWTITEIPTFVAASPMAGIRSGDVLVTTLSENDSTGTREGLLTVQDTKGHIQYVIVRQQQK